MTIFLLVAAYLVAWLVTSRIAYVKFDKDDPDAFGEDANAWTAMLLGVVWPLVLIWVILSKGLQMTVLRETRAQRERKAAQESRTMSWEAAKMAKEYGLPIPPEDEELLRHVTPKIGHNCILEGCVKRGNREGPMTRDALDGLARATGIPFSGREVIPKLEGDDGFPFIAKYDAG